MNECIRLEKISKSYGNRKILTELDFSANIGELVVIKGKSGCGKSTLLNVIGQLDSYDSGNVFFESKRITHGYQRNMLRSQKIGFIFQAFQLLENLSVIDNIKMPFLYSDSPMPKNVKKMIDDIIDTLQLQNVKWNKIKNLSGGEKQRVAIARAIIRNPLLLVADEPTGNLDPENSEIVSSILKEYTNTGKTVIVVTHSEDCFQNADVIYRLEGGILT